jgi:predicted lipid-binding transport protein (Tim44 family)
MMRIPFRTALPMRILLGALILLVYAAPSSAVLGTRRRTAVVAYSAGASHGAEAASSAAASQQAAAAQQSAAAQQTAAAQSAAAASQAAAASAAAASQAAAAAAHPAAPAKTTQQKLQELQSLYDQKLITKTDYDAAKAKILSEVTQ